MALSKLKLNPEKTECIVLVLRYNVRRFPLTFLSVFLEVFFIQLTLSKTWAGGLMQNFPSLNMFGRLIKLASSRCMTFVEKDSILLLKLLSLLQISLVSSHLDYCISLFRGCHVSISTSCRALIIPLLTLSQIIESMLMLHPP